ncbi:hypothetical protein KQX54_002649 [Cotesia glomerata]|uniref:Uncharacterized protein n=1 Tax=Cotesia glomerata TaxID=32391 RepID=A0AAV7IP28_COTGL|nr:hypothetical protein KQX54_002649 [Cotesia glomerata]
MLQRTCKDQSSVSLIQLRILANISQLFYPHCIPLQINVGTYEAAYYTEASQTTQAPKEVHERHCFNDRTHGLITEFQIPLQTVFRVLCEGIEKCQEQRETPIRLQNDDEASKTSDIDIE